MSHFFPNTFDDCSECPHCQFQGAVNTGTALLESYICRFLRVLGTTFLIEFKRVGDNPNASPEFQKAFTPHEKCPLRGRLDV